MWIAVDKVDEFRVAVIGLWRYCRRAVTSLLWPTISDFLRAAHGSICLHCIASALALPGSLVTMATLGLTRRGAFEVEDGVCGRCRMRRRVIRCSHQGPSHAPGITASFEIQPREDPNDQHSST